MTALSREQVCAWRLARDHLDARVPRGDLLSVVSRLCVHARLMGSAALTLWARVERLEPDAVARAL